MGIKAFLLILAFISGLHAMNNLLNDQAVFGRFFDSESSRFINPSTVNSEGQMGPSIGPAILLQGFDSVFQNFNRSVGFTIETHYCLITVCDNTCAVNPNLLIFPISADPLEVGVNFTTPRPFFSLNAQSGVSFVEAEDPSASAVFTANIGATTAMATQGPSLIYDNQLTRGLSPLVQICAPNSWNYLAVTFVENTVTFYYTDPNVNRDQNAEIGNVVMEQFVLGESIFDQVPDPNTYIAANPAGNNIYGNLDEVRIWNRALTQTEINEINGDIVSPDSDGLIVQLSFDETPNFPTILNSAIAGSEITASLIDANRLNLGLFTPTTANIYGAAPNRGTYARINRRLINLSVGESYSAAMDIVGPVEDLDMVSSLVIQSTPTAGMFTIDTPQDGDPLMFTFNAINPTILNATNDLCVQGNGIQTLVISASTTLPFEVIFDVSVSPAFDQIIYPVGTADPTGVPTTGGQISIMGSGFGPAPGSLVNPDGINLMIDGTSVPCQNAQLFNINGVIGLATCDVPPGVGGAIPLTLAVCNGDGTTTIRYGTPIVSSIAILDRELTITGANFGESNRSALFGITEQNQILFGETSVQCPLVSIDHTQIVCTIPQQFNPSDNVFLDMNITIIIGGQMAVGALRIGGEDGVSDSETPLIIGLTVGFGGCCCIMICVIVILGIAYKKKKGGQVAVAEAPFTPVEKKDFSTVIFGSENAPAPKKSNENQKLLELLVNDPEMKLALEIGELTQITEADSISKAMVIVFENSNKTLDMLKYYIEQEVLTVENPATLFRANSMVSKMFKFYSRLIGLPYLYKTIGKTITQLNFENLGIEVDPEKMVEGEDLNEMRWTLLAQSQKILKHILNSASNCPVQFRHLCWQLKESVSERYEDHIDKTIGGFIFLRFFCPAVTSPEIYGILEDAPSSSSRRLLILITKSLQNLANDVEFGSKEPYMSNMNDFINENRGKLHEFYEKIILKPSDDQGESAKFPKGVPDKSLQELAEHLSNNLDKIKNQELRRELSELLQK